MGRQLFLDTETTGLEPRLGHRIIEVACVEMVNRQLTGRHFHRYLNPDREIDAGAEAVHGISSAFLQDKPRFADIVDELVAFVEGAELVIHNAAFDVGFLDHELALLSRPGIASHCSGIVDSLKMARDLHPGQKNNLDALCRRYEIDNSGRNLHGALLDAELLAAVWLSMTRGQDSLVMELEPGTTSMRYKVDLSALVLHPVVVSADEMRQHELVLEAIQKESKGNCLWLSGEAVRAE